MKVKKSQARQLFHAIDQWISDSLISAEDGEKLRQSIEIVHFDYRRLAKYSFRFAIACFVISAGAFIVSPVFQAIVNFFQLLFTFINPKVVVGSLAAIFAGGAYTWGLRRRKSCPQTVYKNEALLFLGILFTATAVASFCSLFEQKDIAPVFLLASAVYGGLGLYFPSTLVWTFALLSLGSWFGCETGYISGSGAYFLGMNYPLRFIPFGACVIGVAFFLRSIKQPDRYQQFFKSTYVIGLLYLFIALWILSIWGNSYGADRSNLLWSLLFGAAALGSIFYGLKHDDGISRGFGITFLAINLYTKYFEYFWNVADKTFFFLALGLSFWLIGSRAEKIWLFISKKQPQEGPP